MSTGRGEDVESRLSCPGDDGKHEGGVFHGAGQRAHLIERGTVGDDAVAGYAPVGGFEAHAAAQGCGLADGAAGVRAEGGVALVRGDAGGRAAAGASGDAFWIAGVAGRAEGGVFRGGAMANSSMLFLPTMTAPASFRRSTTKAS